MCFQIISMRLGKDEKKILKSYSGIEKFGCHSTGGELFVTVESLEDLMTLIKKVIKQNCFICHDENVIHIYDAKLR